MVCGIDIPESEKDRHYEEFLYLLNLAGNQDDILASTMVFDLIFMSGLSYEGVTYEILQYGNGEYSMNLKGNINIQGEKYTI